MKRYVELDLLRTLAIVLMVIYHACYDLQMFYGWNLGLFTSMCWYVLRQGTASLFLLLVGCSFAISWSRTPRFLKYLKRGLGVFACGMLVSAVTYWMDPETYVRFGILHLIGVSIVLLPMVAMMREWNAIPGLMILGLGLELGQVQTSLLLPLGWMPPDFSSVDYFPMIPWFGIVLIGFAAGQFIYVRHSDSPLPQGEGSGVRAMSWPGQHALIIYLLHQPLIFGVLRLLGFFGFL